MTMVKWLERWINAGRWRDEQLSAYLDHRLAPVEARRLEARLRVDPALRRELKALHRTVALAHQLPSVPVPRNFVLPRTVALRPRQLPVRGLAWAAPLLTAATAAASLLLVVVLAGNVLLSATYRRAVVEAPVALHGPVVVETVVVEVERVAPAATEAAAEAPQEAAPPPSVQEKGAAVATPEHTIAADMASGAGAAPEAPAEALTAEAEPTASLALPDDDARIEAATAPTVAEESALLAAAPLTGTDALEGPLPEPQTGAESAPDSTGEGSPGERGASSRLASRMASLPWPALEIGLGLATVALAAVTVQAWRVRRR